ncbi:MAG TPA: hypothetical protein VF584_14815 [Longimicrobium sp.]|jgi:hypothetical protein
MPNDSPLSERELAALEALACEATPGPWEAQTVLDFQTGDATLAVTHSPRDSDDLVFVVEREAEVSPANQRYIAALHPDATLRLLGEVRRLRGFEEQIDSMRSVLRHLDAFLEQRGLAQQARRFIELRSQSEHLHPVPSPTSGNGSLTQSHRGN